ncbi:MAG: carbohydrate kinase family protein [Candidatus Woesearchaeota archaeon]
MYDVITCGSATVDAFVQTGDKLFRGSDGMVSVPFGSKICVDDIMFDVGGGGTNTAVCFARMGFKVAFLGKIGRGTNSERVLKLLKKEGIDTSLIKRGTGRTGFSVILDAFKHERTILTFKGSNDTLKFSEVKLNRLKTRWLYCSSMMNESLKTIEKVFVWAKKKRIGLMFNPSSYLTEKGPSFLKTILANCSVLVLNKQEAMMLAQRNRIEDLLVSLRKLGPEIVLITDGENGVHALYQRMAYSIRPHKIDVVETTGAGDAFGAGFLSGWIKTGDIEFSLKLGLITAESVIQKVGGKRNLPTYKEAVSTMKKLETPISMQRL